MVKRKAQEMLMRHKRRRKTNQAAHEATKTATDKTSQLSRTWMNKQRVLVFAARGVSYRGRHLMLDLRTLMPHSKADVKMNSRAGMFQINEICDMKNCNKCVFFECRKKKDLFMWFANVPHGPSAKFLIENLHTMSELKLTGNCLRGARPILSFGKEFDEEPHYQLLKELFIQIFSTPNLHPKSQPFFDHMYTFSVLDNRIWFRNYQILEEDGSLVEIGPRFCLNLIRIFKGSIGGPTLYENPKYISPNEQRRFLKKQLALKFQDRKESMKGREERRLTETYKMDNLDEVFHTIRPEDAKGSEKLTFFRKTATGAGSRGKKKKTQDGNQ
ncbi:ribosome biogenesis protein BRX1 homolog [Patiria miniata]|uniref:Ribosome biogenesis protein BRX1 homolog n=1 Tax=Patiria miniata TaxID=46514 RepID=A0A913ZBT3_PATMI|nr:ribosome biogenesis protein BRX1 homolog [Patiria miniata]